MLDALKKMSARRKSGHHRRLKDDLRGGLIGLRWPDWRSAAFYAFLALTMLTGGSSRSDSPFQIVAQLTAIAMLVIALLIARAHDLNRYRVGLGFAVAIVLLVCGQLLPLPPSVWLALPGREFYGQAAQLAGIDQPWRPISLSPEATWNALLFLLSPLAAFAGHAVIGRHRASEYVPLLLFVAMLSAILGLFQIGGGLGSPLRWYGVTDVNTPDGIFANRNHQAILLCISIPAAACWARLSPDRSVNRVRGWIAIGIVAFFVEMLLFCGSRSGLALGVLSLIAAAGVLLLTRRRETGKLSGWVRWQLPAVGAALAMVVALTIGFSRAVSIDRLSEIDVASEKRVAVIKPGLEMIREFFPVGTGVSTFDPVFRRFEPLSMLTPQYLNQAHNELLQLAIEAGAAGCVLAILYCLWWAHQSARIFGARALIDRPAWLLAALGITTTGTILLSSYGEYALRTPFFASLFVITSLWIADGGLQRRSETAAAQSEQ